MYVYIYVCKTIKYIYTEQRLALQAEIAKKRNIKLQNEAMGTGFTKGKNIQISDFDYNSCINTNGTSRVNTSSGITGDNTTSVSSNHGGVENEYNGILFATVKGMYVCVYVKA